MDDTVENILNETPQVVRLVRQLSKYSLSIDGKIEELTDILARFIAMKRGYDEVPWDLFDQNFNFTCEFRDDYCNRRKNSCSERATKNS